MASGEVLTAQLLEKRVGTPQTWEEELQGNPETAPLLIRLRDIVQRVDAAQTAGDLPTLTAALAELTGLNTEVDDLWFNALAATTGETHLLVRELQKIVEKQIEDLNATIKKLPVAAVASTPTAATTTAQTPPPVVPVVPPPGPPDHDQINERAMTGRVQALEAVINELVDPAQTLAALEAKIAAAGYFAPGNPDFATDTQALLALRTRLEQAQDELNEVRETFKVGAQGKFQEIQKLNAFNAQIEALHVPNQLRRINNALIQIWEGRADLGEEVPELKVVFEVLPFAPTAGVTPEAEFRARQAYLADLQTKLQAAEAAVAARPADPNTSIQNRQEAYIKVKLDRARALLSGETAAALAQWQANVEVIYPNLGVLRVNLDPTRLTQPVDEADAQLQIASLETQLALFKSQIGPEGAEPAYQNFLQTTYWQLADNRLTELRTLAEQFVRNAENVRNLETEFDRCLKDLTEALDLYEGREQTNQTIVAKYEATIDKSLERMDEIAAILPSKKLEAENARKDKDARLGFYLAWWQMMAAKTLQGQKNWPTDIPADYNFNTEHQDWLLNHCEATGNNEVLNPHAQVEWFGFTNPRVPNANGVIPTEILTFRETAVGRIFRELDDIYKARKPAYGADGTAINSNNVHVNLTPLFETIKSRVPGVTDQIVRNAWRLHWVMTLHQSYLVPPTQNVQQNDVIFQAGEANTYIHNAAGGGTEKHALMAMNGLMSLGRMPIYNAQGVVEYRKVTFFPDEEKDKIRAELASRFPGYEWMADMGVFEQMPLFYDQADLGFTGAPPLAYNPISMGPGTNKVLRIPLPGGGEGRAATAYDIQSLPSNTPGVRPEGFQIIYENIPWKTGYSPGWLSGYYTDVQAATADLYLEVIKKTPAEFVKLMETSAKEKVLNTLKYFTNFAPQVGVEVRAAGLKDLGPHGNGDQLHDKMQKRAWLACIYAFLLYATQDKKAGENWNQEKVRLWLENLKNSFVAADKITFTEQDEALMHFMVIEKHRWGLLAMNAAEGLADQIRKSAILR